MNLTYMPNEAKQLNVDLWEAWVDLQIPGNTGGGTLYIIGDIVINNLKARPSFIKRPSDNDERELVLEIMPAVLTENGVVTEILYSEELRNPLQYTSITVYSNNEMIAHITEIEQLP